ncbi:uncharacterized protein LOC116427529 [Nomia melanderi]|uniref:uncharacterized protein LOC116427529 n=1 Tax=Nomia melanderi TaxID=2448451 RepID=UPI003FCDDC98
MALSTSLFLLSGILFGLFIGRIEAAPASYDQRQTGELNVDAKLDNFLIVVANTFNEGLLEKLASQAALQLSLLTARRSNAAKQGPGKPLEATVYETEDKEEGREPYHVEIVHIEKDGDDTRRKYPPPVLAVDYFEDGQGKVTEKAGQKTSTDEPDPQVSINDKNVEKRSRSVWGNQKNRRLIGERSKGVLHVDSSEENLAQADDLVAREVSKAARPGISLKKQLSKKEEELSLVSEERNELSNKSDELVLLGGGVENCGPGRYRDKSGICQEDKAFYKDLY